MYKRKNKKKQKNIRVRGNFLLLVVQNMVLLQHAGEQKFYKVQNILNQGVVNLPLQTSNVNPKLILC